MLLILIDVEEGSSISPSEKKDQSSKETSSPTKNESPGKNQMILSTSLKPEAFSDIFWQYAQSQ